MAWVASNHVREANEAQFEAHHAEQRAVAQEAATRHKQADAELLAQAPAILERAAAQLREAQSSFDQGEYRPAMQRAKQASGTLRPLANQPGNFDGVALLSTQSTNLESAARAYVEAAGTLEGALARAKHQMPDVLAYDDQLQSHLRALSAITGDAREKYAKEIRSSTMALEKKRIAIRPAVRKAERERERVRALAERCGSAPALSPYDGELVGSEAYLQEDANDPDSIDVEDCSNPVLSEELCWVTQCRVRGRNAFGALVLSRVAFSVAGGRILDAQRLR